MNFDDIFQHVFVINLDEHLSRWETSEYELAKVGIKNYKRFPGIKTNDGQKLDDRNQGCKQSHLKLIEYAKVRNLKNIVIFEDDIEFDKIFLLHMPTIIKFITEEEWELFYLGANHLVSNKKFEKINPNLLKVKGALTTHAYIVHHTAYNFIINAIKQSNYGKPIDVVYAHTIQSRGNSYAINPNLVYQRKGFSFIRQGYRDYTSLRKKI